MRKIVSCILAMMLLASALLMTVIPVGASPAEYKKLFEGDNKITRDELATEICSCMFDRGALTLEELRDASHVHVYWKNGEPRTITDSAKRTVTIYKPVKRIVALNSDCAEAIRAIGAKDRIVGIESATAKYKKFFPEISTLSSVGAGNIPDPEKVLEMKPDILIAYAPGIYNPGYEVLEAKLEPMVTVVRLNLYKPETLAEDVLNLGYLLEEEENAREYVEWRDRYVDEIKATVSGIPEVDKPKVFIDYGQSPFSSDRLTSAKGTGNHQMCEGAGGINIAANLPPGLAPGYPYVSLEWVVNQTPEVIIGQASGYNTRGGGYETDDDSALKAYYNEIRDLPGIKTTPAYNRIYIIQGDVAGGLTEIVGLAYHAKWFHPELFGDLKDPQDIHQEYIDNFCGIEFNVREDGVFVYPP